MLKIIRHALYGAAIFIGLLGLAIGGIPLVKYALDMLHNYESQYYYDTHYLNEPEIIILLSLILLVGVRIAMALEKGVRPPNYPDAGATVKKPMAAALNETATAPLASWETPTPPVESTDEKLTRLLNTKKD